MWSFTVTHTYILTAYGQLTLHECGRDGHGLRPGTVCTWMKYFVDHPDTYRRVFLVKFLDVSDTVVAVAVTSAILRRTLTARPDGLCRPHTFR